jgi:hypothetical protein
MDPYDFGRTVTEDEAHMYVEDYKTLRDSSETFRKSKVNAFVFNAELIKSLFEGVDPATYFAVFLGAVGDEPTIVAAGLREGPNPNTLIASPLRPPPEHPWRLIEVKYPSAANGPITIPG